jgi:MoaA/NifB/PqqE/SkfB family radical SAM enzyme
MYTTADYISRAARFVRNQLQPGDKVLSTLMIYATDLCQSRCKHCLIWAKRPVAYLSLDKIVEIMQSDCVSKTTTVGLEGGEFLLHPQAFEILDWFSRHHPNFDLLSNCLAPDKVIKAVREYSPKRLFISLDGNKETYRFMRGKDGYDKVLNVIETLHKESNISVMFTLSPYNSFDDLRHVMEVCAHYGTDLRIGIYNNISYFDTVDPAHTDDTAIKETMPLPSAAHMELPTDIIQRLQEFEENLDFLQLYKYWQRKELKMPCYSIFDSLVVLPNGDVPICQNLDLKLGNVYTNTLDHIFNDAATVALQQHYCQNCNGCWINFHRKYDITLLRQAERVLGKRLAGKLLGDYHWNLQNESFRTVMAKV